MKNAKFFGPLSLWTRKNVYLGTHVPSNRYIEKVSPKDGDDSS